MTEVENWRLTFNILIFTSKKFNFNTWVISIICTCNISPLPVPFDLLLFPVLLLVPYLLKDRHLALIFKVHATSYECASVLKWVSVNKIGFASSVIFYFSHHLYSVSVHHSVLHLSPFKSAGLCLSFVFIVIFEWIYLCKCILFFPICFFMSSVCVHNIIH